MYSDPLLQTDYIHTEHDPVLLLAPIKKKLMGILFADIVISCVSFTELFPLRLPSYHIGASFIDLFVFFLVRILIYSSSLMAFAFKFNQYAAYITVSSKSPVFRTLSLLTTTLKVLCCLQLSWVSLKVLFMTFLDTNRPLLTQKYTLLYFISTGIAVLSPFTTYRIFVYYSALWNAQFMEESLENSTNREKPGKSTTMYDILALSFPDKWYLLAGWTCLMVSSISQSFVPHYIGKIIDEIFLNSIDTRKLFVALTISILLSSIFSGLRGMIFTINIAQINIRVRNKLYASLLAHDMVFHDETPIGDLLNRLSSDTSKMSDQISLNLNIFLRNFVQSICTLYFMIRLSWRITLLSLIAIPLMILVTKSFSEKYKTLVKIGQTQLAEANSLAQRSFSSITTIKAFNGEQYEAKQYSQVLVSYLQTSTQRGGAYGFYVFATTLLPNMMIIGVILYGETLVRLRIMTAGELFSFMLYIYAIFDAFQAMSSVWTGFASAIGSAQKVIEYIQRTPKIVQLNNISKEIKGNIEFRNVSFAYPTRQGHVLRNITFHVNRGEVIAFVGQSGAGKSSLTKLLLRFYDVNQGEILIDGTDIREYSLSFLRQNVSIVSQEPGLSGNTIRDNILYGIEGEEEEMEEIMKNAALRAHIDAFITNLPSGYDTVIGDKGVQLSGGQRQRIAIARALAKSPRILILDEATASLDSMSEVAVQAAIDDIIRQETCAVLIIAHRLSTVRNCDRIVVMEDGRITDVASHAELLEKNAFYKKLVDLQQA